MQNPIPDRKIDLSAYGTAIAMSDAPDRLIAFLMAYEAARGNKTAPRRSDLNLRQMASLLPDLTIMERIAPGNVVYRLMGTSVAHRLGTDLTGHNFIEYLDATERLRIDECIALVADRPCGTFSVYENTYASGAHVRAETITLPLDSGSGCAPYLVLGLHSAQAIMSYNVAQQGSVIGTCWRDGVVLDLGFGVPEQSVLDRLKTTP